MRGGRKPSKALSHCLYDKRKQNSSLFYFTRLPWLDLPKEHAPLLANSPNGQHLHSHIAHALGENISQYENLKKKFAMNNNFFLEI